METILKNLINSRDNEINKEIVKFIGLLGDTCAALNRDYINKDLLIKLRDRLFYSSLIIHNYLDSQLDDNIDQYLIILVACSFYLCDLLETSLYWAKHIKSNQIYLEARGLEVILIWLLRPNLKIKLKKLHNPYKEYIDGIIGKEFHWIINKQYINDLTKKLRSYVYENGSPRELLFGDIIISILNKNINLYENNIKNSCR